MVSLSTLKILITCCACGCSSVKIHISMNTYFKVLILTTISFYQIKLHFIKCNKLIFYKNINYLYTLSSERMC